MPPKIQEKEKPPIVMEEVPAPFQPNDDNKNIELEGNGRFEYQDGTVYSGDWKLIGGHKMKHGHGTVIIASTLSQDSGQKEEYSGQWYEDRMEGEGVYRYKSGAIYSGFWRNNMHHGYGKYQFLEGCTYEGEWVDHKMHGQGIFTDKEGNRWEGEFVQGIYQSKMQKQLKMEKMLKKKQDEIQENVKSFFVKFAETFARSDKKTFKENLLPFFATQEEIKLYVKDPFPRFEDRAPEKWADQLKLLSDFTNINVLRNNSQVRIYLKKFFSLQAKIIDPNNILATQFSGIGQVVEIQKDIENRVIKLVLCNASEGQWTIIFYHDNQEETAQPKKK